MLRLVRRFLAVTVLQTVIGFASSVILARTLGPAGRGALAAIIVPLGLLPYVLALGLPTFTSRGIAAGGDVREIVGTAGLMATAIGVVGVVPCIAFLGGFAGSNHGAREVLLVGFALLPVTLYAGILSDAGWGLQQWNRVTAQRLIPPVTVLIGYIVLLALGAMSAATAGAVVVAGGLLSIAPFLPVARRSWPPRFSVARAKEALHFSGFAWLIQTSQLLNHRLDQLMMVPLVSRRELGLYAIAVTVSGVTNMLSPAIGTVLYPKLAAGENIDIARALRRGIAAVAASGALCAAAAPLAVPLVFGASFSAAVPMLLILLVANVPLAGANILASAYTARPKIALASMSEVAANAVTIGGLLLVLPGLGGVGAAIVSLVAYLVNFVWLLVMARRDFGGQFRHYLLVTRGDLSELRARLARSRLSLPMHTALDPPASAQDERSTR